MTHKHLFIIAFVGGALVGYFAAPTIATWPVFTNAYDFGSNFSFGGGTPSGAQ